MKLKVFTLSFDPDRGGFDDHPMQAFLEDRQVLGVHEHFFVHEQVPTLALVVTYRDADRPADRPGRAEEQQRKKKDHRQGLAPDEQALYDALVGWRRERADRDGRPPYVLFDNRVAAEIARRRPGTKEALREINGIGEAKARDYGDALLGLVAAHAPVGATGAAAGTAAAADAGQGAAGGA